MSLKTHRKLDLHIRVTERTKDMWHRDLQLFKYLVRFGILRRDDVCAEPESADCPTADDFLRFLLQEFESRYKVDEAMLVDRRARRLPFG